MPKMIFIICTIVICASVAYFIKGHLLEQGVISLKVGDFDTAIKYFRPMAHLGDTKSQYYMGQCYMFGLGTEKNPDKGVSWLKRASTENDCKNDKCISTELFYIGQKHLEGRWGAINKEEGLYWIKRSAEAGYSQAVDFLDNGNAK